MIGRLGRLRGQVSSRWLGATVATGYLLVSVALAVALLANPRYQQAMSAPAANTPTGTYRTEPADGLKTSPDNGDDAGTIGPSGTVAPPPPPRSPTSTRRAPNPQPPPKREVAAFQRVTGPAGIRTVIPAGWHPVRTTGPGALLATDPEDSSSYVKFGGSDAPKLGIDDSHVRYERDFAARSKEYRRVKLNSAKYGGHEAVEWEFEHRDGDHVLRVRSLYWRAAGNEYFVLAAAPASRWAAMRTVYDAMVANASP